MKISVVCPTYNRGHLIGNSIRSLLRQQKKPDEIIVIDDGSSDNTKEVIGRLSEDIGHLSDNYTRLRYFYRDSPLWINPSVPLNIGIRQAQHELVVFSLSDIVHIGETLTAIEKAHEEDPLLYLIGATMYWVQKDVRIPDENWNDPMEIVRDPSVVVWEPGLIGKDNMIVCQHDLYTSNIASCRKEHLLAVGGFDEELTLSYGFEDSEITQRLYNLKKCGDRSDFHIVRDNTICGIHQWHERTPVYAMVQQTVQQRMVNAKILNITANDGKDWGKL